MQVADTMWKRALGLMFRRSGEMIFIFKKDVNFSVWTPFMRFCIDVFFLNENKKTVEIKRDLKPWRIYRPKNKYRYFFESKTGKYSTGEVENFMREIK